MPRQTEDRGQKTGGQNARPPERDLTAQERPAEAVDDADHWIQGIKQAPVFRNIIAGKTDGGDVETELNDERNDVAKVTVLNVECA